MSTEEIIEELEIIKRGLSRSPENKLNKVINELEEQRKHEIIDELKSSWKLVAGSMDDLEENLTKFASIAYDKEERGTVVHIDEEIDNINSLLSSLNYYIEELKGSGYE